MKTSVQLIVLMATLLLLSGGASAEWCECYEVTCTNLDTGTVVADHPVRICFDPWGDNTDVFFGLCTSYGTTVTFFDSYNKEMLVYDEEGNSGYLKFHGDDQHVVAGIGYCAEDRWTLRGHQVETCDDPSDVTWKQNIEPLSSSLEKVMLLQGVSYDWKVDEYPEKGFTNTRQIGFIAQDVEKVFPELVRTDTNGYKSIYYAQMVAVLLEAMKEQQKEISDLRKQQAMIAALTEKISQLEKALEQKGSNLSASVK